MEHNDAPIVPIKPDPAPVIPRLASELADVSPPQSRSKGIEQFQDFTFRRMVPYRSVPTNEFHVPRLPFTGVEKDAVLVPTIVISIWFAPFSGEKHDEWLINGGRNATLALPTKRFMQVCASVVNPTDLKRSSDRPRNSLAT
jgi:hypothetical protein